MLGRQQWTRSGHRAVTGVGLYAVANAFDAAATFGMMPLITRAVSMGTFAQLTLLLAAAGVALVVIDLGTGIALVRQLSSEKEPAARRTLIATAMWLRLVAALAVGLVAIAASFACEQPLEDSLRIGALWIVAWGMFGGLIEVLRGQELHGAAAGALIVRSFTWASAVLWFVLVNDGGLQQLVLSYGISCAAGLAFAVARAGPRTLLAGPDREVARSLLRFGFPIAGYLGLRTIGGLDRYLVRFRASLDAAAVYQLANMPIAAIEIAERTIVQPTEPYLYGVVHEERERALGRIVSLATFLTGSLAIALTMIGPEMVAILGPAGYAGALGAIPWFTFSALARVVTRAVTLGAGLVGKPRIWAISAAVEIIVAAPTLYFAITVWGVTGAAIARFVAAMISLIAAYVLLRRIWRVDLAMLRICAYMLLSVCVGAAFATRIADAMAPLALRAAIAIALIGLAYVLFVRPIRARESM
jgi:O-antigen/teichoic acid export membrane protein